MVREIALQKDYLRGEKVESVYLGGGTPSILTADELKRLLSALSSWHDIAPDAEVTLEANPDDITPAMLQVWKDRGINRISIGVQGFQEAILEKWNRSHHADQAMQSLQLAQSFGFTNISADLIFGDPMLTDEEWVSNVHSLIRMGIPHLSSYALTVETGTALYHHILQGKSPAPDDAQSLRQYTLLQGILSQSGYEHYEISNFSKPGYESKHNTSYWYGIPYLGIGPAAHSFNRVSRQWNVANNPKYVHAIAEGQVPYEREELSPVMRYHELVMTGMRTSRGIDTIEIARLGPAFLNHFEKQAAKYMAEGKIERTDQGLYRLLPAYYFFADGIASDFFMSNSSN